MLLRQPLKNCLTLRCIAVTCTLLLRLPVDDSETCFYFIFDCYTLVVSFRL